MPSLFSTESDDNETREVGQLLGGWMATQVVRVVAELAVPDHLAGKSCTADELATLTGAAPDPLARLLAVAAVYGIIAREGDRYALTKTGEKLRSDVPGSLRALAMGFIAPPMWDSLGRLGDVVRSSTPVDRGAPGGPWEYFQQHPETAGWFARAMSDGTATMVGQLESAGYGLPASPGRVVDVGGSRGTLLAYLLGTAPDAAGVLFDRAEALAEAPGVLSAAGVADRVELTPGNFFAGVPEGDVHILSNILHDWDDKVGRAILRSCHRAGQPGGLLVVFSFLLSDAVDPPHPQLMDLLMMTVEGGRERTLSEMRALVESGGYEFVRDVPLSGPMPWHVIEFRRQ
jgi:multifunctional cyclase/dehydratase/O-methyltransferase